MTCNLNPEYEEEFARKKTLWEEVGTDHIPEGTGVYGWGVHLMLRMAG